MVDGSDENQAASGQPAGWRPAVAVSCDSFHRAQGMSLTVIPGTFTRPQVDDHLFVHAGETGLKKPIEFLPEPIVTISRSHWRSKVGQLKAGEVC